MFCYTKPSSPPIRSMRHGPRTRRSSSESTGVRCLNVLRGSERRTNDPLTRGSLFLSHAPIMFCRSFRVDISDTLMYVYEMLGAELLSNLYDKLGRLLTNVEQPASWQVGEKNTGSHNSNFFFSPWSRDLSAFSFHSTQRPCCMASSQ